MSKRILKLIRLGLIIAYGIIGVVFYMRIHNFEANYRDHEQKKIETIQSAISNIVKNDPENPSKYKALVDDHNIDLVVTENTTIIYKSVPFTNESDFNESTNPRSILFQSKGAQTSNGKMYNIYLKVHQIPDDEYFKPFIYELLMWLIIAVALLMVGIYVVVKLLIPSLESIRGAVDRLKNYDSDQHANTESGANVIVGDIDAISEKISSDFDAVSRHYTQLEVDLKRTETILDNSITVARTFIHDLKSPIHYGIMKNEVLLEKLAHNDVARQILEFNIENGQVLMSRTNEILKILGGNYGNIAEDKEVFDLSNLTNEMMRYFAKVFKLKRIYISLNYEPNIKLESNIVMLQLLSHNLIANILNYATPESEADISIEKIDDKIVMCYKNETTKSNLDRLRQTEKIFNVARNQDNPYSSGNGLYLVKDITSMLGGTYELVVNADYVETIVTLPVGNVQ